MVTIKPFHSIREDNIVEHSPLLFTCSKLQAAATTHHAMHSLHVAQLMALLHAHVKY